MKKIFDKKTIITVLISGFVFSVISVYATTVLLANQVAYDNNISGLTSENVQGALDELNTKTNVGNATSSQILENASALVNGVLITGSMPNNGAWNNTPTTNTKVTIPNGYHDGTGYVDTNEVYQTAYNKGKDEAKANPNSLIPYGTVWASQGSSTTMSTIGRYYRASSGQATANYDITFMYNGATSIRLYGSHERSYQPSGLNGGQADFYDTAGTIVQTKTFNLSRSSSGSYSETISIPSNTIKVRIYGMIGDSTSASDGCQGTVSATIS